MALWEYRVSGSAEKQINEASLYLVNNPTQTYTLSAAMMPKASLSVEIAKVIADNATAYTYAASDGTSFTGIPKGISYQIVPGTTLYDVTLTLQQANSSTKWGWTLSGSVTRNDVNGKSQYATDEPDEIITVKAKRSPYSQVTTQVNAAKSGITTGTYSLLNGGSVSGIIKSVSYDENEGTGLFDISVTLQVVKTLSVIWAWVGSGSITRNTVKAKSWGGAVGARYYAGEEADETLSITAKNVPKATVDSERAKAKTITTSTYSYTMDDGSTCAGIIKGMSWKAQDGTGLYDVTITLESTT